MATEARLQSIERAAIKQDGTGLLVRRWLATWLDFTVLFAGLVTLAFAPSAMVGQGREPSDAAVAAAGIGCFVWVVGYYVVCEALWGRTVGKLVSGIIVVGPGGEKPGFGRASLRTLTRLVEVNPFLAGGLPAGIICLFSEKNRRLGDMAANTYVLTVKGLRDATARDTDVFD